MRDMRKREGKKYLCDERYERCLCDERYEKERGEKIFM